VLVDTVWEPFVDELIRNISEVVDPSKIDIVVSDHAESDHSGGLPAVMRYAPNAKLVGSKHAAESISGHYHTNWNFQSVQTGDRLRIGKNELLFIETPMLHWPDSMFTYLTADNVLMSSDAFGQHYATAFRFNDQVNQAELYEEALKYYVNILTPYSHLVSRQIESLLSMHLPVDIIAPSHGVIWRSNPVQVVEKYQEWAVQKPEPVALILFDTMWNGTRRMADAIGDGLKQAGVDHKILHMAVTDRNDALVEVFKARTLIIGSPTLNNGLLPTLTPVLEDIRGLKFKNKLGAAFGCYGWSGECVRIIEQHFAQCKIPLVREGIKCKWQPTAQELESCRAFGKEIGEATRRS
jgi:flavorubredoxin